MEPRNAILMTGRFSGLKEAALHLQDKGVKCEIIRPDSCNPNS